jgi:hypothetical protein
MDCHSRWDVHNVPSNRAALFVDIPLPLDQHYLVAGKANAEKDDDLRWLQPFLESMI